MSKWTKREIKALCRTIDAHLLATRPLGLSYDVSGFRATFIEYLGEHRLAIITHYLTENVARSKERLRADSATAGHFVAHPEVYGASTPMMVERFRGFAVEETKALKWTEKLLAKTAAEPLPDEVIAYLPWRGI